MDSLALLRIFGTPEAVVGITVALVFFIKFWLLGSEKKVLDSPVLGHPGQTAFGDALVAGYQKYKDSTFTIPTVHHSIVIVPSRFLNEIKNQPEHVLSFQKQVCERFIGKYTGLGVNDTLVHSVKVDLTKNIARFLGELQDEVDYSVKEHIGDCPDWKPIRLYPTLSSLVALLSGRIFVGLPLNRDTEWINATLNYTIDGFVGSDKLWKYPRFLHPVARYFVPEIQKVHAYLEKSARMLKPIIEERHARMQNYPVNKPTQDMVQWIMENSSPENSRNVHYISKTQMLISVVAIHTTSMTMAQAVFDLISHPEYIRPLRDEVTLVHEKYGNVWTKASVAALRKMDSFLKESQRFRPPGLVTMNRRCEVDVMLSNGVVLPKGTHVGVAAGANALDETLFENASDFDGFRFERLRSQPGSEAKYQFVTANDTDQLHWGVGSHTCPGRFFASYEIKMLLAKIITEYDIIFKPGHGRPPDIARDIRIIPNPAAELLFRNRI